MTHFIIRVNIDKITQKHNFFFWIFCYQSPQIFLSFGSEVCRRTLLREYLSSRSYIPQGPGSGFILFCILLNMYSCEHVSKPHSPFSLSSFPQLNLIVSLLTLLSQHPLIHAEHLAQGKFSVNICLINERMNEQINN